MVTGLTVSGAYPWPSPVTEFCNPGSNSACALQTASGCTTNGTTTTITCSSGGFTSAADVGASITGTDIPAGATITTVSSATKIIISAAATGSTTTGTATIGVTTTGTDYVFFSVNRGNKTGCTTTAGNGCILSYNVSTPTAVAISGSGVERNNPRYEWVLGDGRDSDRQRRANEHLGGRFPDLLREFEWQQRRWPYRRDQQRLHCRQSATIAVQASQSSP